MTAKDCTTGAAAENTGLPGWEATIVQVPKASIEAVLPETLHAEVMEAKLTANPELAEAVRFNDDPTV